MLNHTLPIRLVSMERGQEGQVFSEIWINNMVSYHCVFYARSHQDTVDKKKNLAIKDAILEYLYWSSELKKISGTSP